MDSITYSPEIQLIPITEGDLPFLAKVYASTRIDEMALTGWTEDQVNEFIGMQFDFQHQYYMAHFDTASFDKIMYEDKEAGRIYVDRRENEIRIIDIALLPEFRRKGIGKKLLHCIMEEAAQINQSVTIHVEHFNSAIRFYDKLGFRMIRDDGGYFLMEWSPYSEHALEKSGEQQ